MDKPVEKQYNKNENLRRSAGRERMKPVPLSLFTTGIYGYLDFVLIGWTLGLVWLAVRALVTAKGSFAQKVRAGLSDEVFLFGGWGGDTRTAVGGWMFLLSVVLLQFDMFFMNSLVRELDLPWYSFLASCLNSAYSMFLILKTVLFTRYSGRQLAAAYCFFFVFRWVYLNNHQYWFAMALFYMLAAKDAPLRRTLKAGLVTSCASFLAVVLASSAGWIGTLSELWDDGRMRNSFGYGWYNLTGVIVLALCLMYVCLRQVRNLKWFDFVVLAAALVFCNEGPASRAAVVCLALLIALTLLLRFLPGIARPVWVRALVSAAPVLALAASLLGSWLYTPDNALLVKLNDIFTGRLYLANKALSETSLAIAGQGLWDADYVVDNCFANLWIYAGPVASVLLWGAMAALLWRLMKKGAVTESACLVVMLAHGFMENHVIWPCINVCLWLMPCVLFLLPKERVGDFAPDTGAPQTAF